MTVTNKSRPVAETYSGRCLCGAIRYEVRGPVTNVCFCHCESCRRAAGASPVAWGTVPRQFFKVLTGSLREHASSPEVMRGFCATCGTSLTYVQTTQSSAIDFTLATLDDPAALQPEMHIWLQDKLPWVHIDDGLPHHKRSRTDAGA